MKVIFLETRKYGGGIGLKHVGETADVTSAQKAQLLAQGLIEDDIVKKQKETQTAKPATTSKED